VTGTAGVALLTTMVAAVAAARGLMAGGAGDHGGSGYRAGPPINFADSVATPSALPNPHPACAGTLLAVLQIKANVLAPAELSKSSEPSRPLPWKKHS
jgi:hypothetical protein